MDAEQLKEVLKVFQEEQAKLQKSLHEKQAKALDVVAQSVDSLKNAVEYDINFCQISAQC